MNKILFFSDCTFSAAVIVSPPSRLVGLKPLCERIFHNLKFVEWLLALTLIQRHFEVNATRSQCYEANNKKPNNNKQIYAKCITMVRFFFVYYIE